MDQSTLLNVLQLVGQAQQSTVTGISNHLSLPQPASVSTTQTKECLNYKVKIINPKRKREAITGILHNFHEKFKTHIMDEFGEKIPRDLTFSVGFFENSTKNWLLRDEDLSVMYKKFQEKSQKEI